MVMLLPYQNQSQKTGNHQATGITARMGCKFGTSFRMGESMSRKTEPQVRILVFQLRE